MKAGLETLKEQDFIRADETLDQLHCGGLKLIQHRRGYRFSLDPVLLVHFATVKPYEHVLDMGCGCGVIALLLARMWAGINVTGVEIQGAQAERARRSARLNSLDGRVSFEIADVCSWEPEQRIGFDRVVCNPPFRSPRDGRISSGDERSMSRHEICGTLEDFIRAAARLLRHKGTLSMVHLPERLADIVTSMRACGLEPKRVRMVHSRSGEDARLLLIEARHAGGRGMVVEAPLYVYADGNREERKAGVTPRRNYTTEVASYYDDC